MNTDGLQMRTMNDEDMAHHTATIRNGRRVEWVVVEGPNENEWTVMRINDAIEGGFAYSWRAR